MLILYGCTNDSATINSVTIRPLVAATYGATIGPTLSEGIAVSLQSQPLDRDAQYQLRVTSPDELFRWEKSVTPFLVDSVLYVGASDLLLPPDLQLDSGQWSIELFLPDGQRLNQDYQFERPFQAITNAQLAVAVVEEMAWGEENEQTILYGLSTDPWQYQLYSDEGILLAAFGSDTTIINHPLFQDGSLKDQTRMIVALRYDEKSGIYLMVRQIFI